MKTKKILLPDQMIPVQWYNIVADMPQKPLPPLDPRTRRPVTAEQMNCIFAEELVRQEFSTERFIDIPDEVRNLYRIWRCTPLVRADALERALDTPGEDLFQERKRLARRLAQAQHGPAAGLLQRQTGHQAPDDRNGRRTMGFGHRAGQPVLRPRPESLHGQGQLRAETLPQVADEHVGSRGDPLAQHADRRGTPRSGRRSRLLGQPRAGDLRGGRDSRTAPRRHALLPGQRTEPRAAAPDRHRRGGARADGDGGRRTRRGDPAASAAVRTSQASASRSCAATSAKEPARASWPSNPPRAPNSRAARSSTTSATWRA